MEDVITMRVAIPANTRLSRGTSGSAGLDIFVGRDVDIKAGCREAVDTGMCFEIPDGNVGLVMARSSMAMQGLMVLGGVIDSDYRGPVRIFLANIGNEDVHIPATRAVAQLVIIPYTRCNLENVCSPDKLETTVRAAGGFGSTDIDKDKGFWDIQGF